MSIKVNPKKIGAEIFCNINKLTKVEIKQIKLSLIKYGLIYFRKQNLNSKSYIKYHLKI